MFMYVTDAKLEACAEEILKTYNKYTHEIDIGKMLEAIPEAVADSYPAGRYQRALAFLPVYEGDSCDAISLLLELEDSNYTGMIKYDLLREVYDKQCAELKTNAD